MLSSERPSAQGADTGVVIHTSACGNSRVIKPRCCSCDVVWHRLVLAYGPRADERVPVVGAYKPYQASQRLPVAQVRCNRQRSRRANKRAGAAQFLTQARCNHACNFGATTSARTVQPRAGATLWLPPLCALGLSSERRYCRSGSARYGIEVALPDSSPWPAGARGVSAGEATPVSARWGAALAAPVAAAKTA